MHAAWSKWWRSADVDSVRTGSGQLAKSTAHIRYLKRRVSFFCDTSPLKPSVQIAEAKFLKTSCKHFAYW